MLEETKQEKQSTRSFCNYQFLVRRKISSGSFGVVYLGVNQTTREEVAIKVERSENDEIKSLDREIIILTRLNGLPGVPRYYWSGQEGGQHALVMQVVGLDLAHYMKSLRRFSIKSVLMIAENVMTILQGVHGRGVVHRDMKPENILMGKDTEQQQIYLVDYGISKIYKDVQGRHIPFRDSKPFIGTTRYAALAAHRGQELSRKDDIESMVYVLIFLFKGSLPWQNISQTDRDRTRLVGEMKMSMDLGELCKDMPIEIQCMLEYTRKLNFRDAPDYMMLLNLIRKAGEALSITFDGMFDWTDPVKKYRTYESSNSNEGNKKPSPAIERRMTNQMWWSVNDGQGQQLQQQNLLQPPDRYMSMNRASSLSPSNSSNQHLSQQHSLPSQQQGSIQGSYSSMKIRYVPTIINEDDGDMRGSYIPFKSVQPQRDQKQYNIFQKSKTLGQKPEDMTFNYKEALDENFLDEPLHLKYSRLQFTGVHLEKRLFDI